MKKLYLVLLVLLLAEVNAMYMFVEFDNNKINKYIYYSDPRQYQTSTGASPISQDTKLKVTYTNGNSIYVHPSQSGYAYLSYAENIINIKLYKNDSLVEDKDIILCNNNGICEPCIDTCIVSENELTCQDCLPKKDKNSIKNLNTPSTKSKYGGLIHVIILMIAVIILAIIIRKKQVYI